MASMSNENYHDEKFLKEIRPGRTILVRRVRWGSTTTTKLQMVFQHGTLGTQLQFDLLLQCFRVRCRGSDISIEALLYDAVGCGAAPPPVEHPLPEAYTNDALAADLAALVETYLDASLPTVWVGHSYGPSILLHYFQTQPSSLPPRTAIIWLGTTVRSSHLSLPNGGHPIMRLPVFVLNWIQPLLTNEFIRQAVHPDHKELQQAVRNASNGNDMSVAQAYHGNMQFATTTDLACCRSLPSLVVHGRVDQLIPLACANDLVEQLSPHAELVVVERASHLVMVEQPDAVATAIWEFLTNQGVIVISNKKLLPNDDSS